MRVKATINVIGKVSKPWKDLEGKEHLSYSANIMQCNGEVIDTIRLTREQFDTVESGKNYTLTADYGTGKNGAYLKIVDITESK